MPRQNLFDFDQLFFRQIERKHFQQFQLQI